jgi:hypothetical protein
MEGQSTTHKLLITIYDWLREIGNKKIMGAVLLDFSAAFDINDHNLLLEKHMCYDFTSPAILWIERYLSNRTQRVFFYVCLSNIIQVESGIPQGSFLGPLLFSIFTNDLPLGLSKTCVSMCADD